MRWLAGCSARALHEALEAVAPELSGYDIPVPEPASDGDPHYHKSSVVLGDRFVVKFAWSRPAALRLAREIDVLTTLSAEPAVPYLPEVTASSMDPLLLVTRYVPGRSLFDVVGSIDLDGAAGQLASFLAALHLPVARERAEAVIGPLTGAEIPPATTDVLRAWFDTRVRPEQRRLVRRWCDWADAVLASAALDARTALVHGDLHGDNQVWDGNELRLVVDFETVGAAEPEYDLRTFPGPGMGPGVQLLTATMRHYERLSGRALSLERVMAWHVRTALGDVVWRTEAGIPLADHRTPPDWIDDLVARFQALGMDRFG